MTAAGDEEARRAERARAVALFRYSLIREAADPGLSTRQRGRLVRELAAASMPGRSASRSRCRGPAWTAGSGPGGPAGSTRWPRRPARSPRGPRPRCSTWPRR